MPRSPHLLLTPSRVAGAALTVAAMALGLAAPAQAGQGSGSPRLEVSQASVPIEGSSTITVTGIDYLVPPYAPGTQVFGGIYLFFGWVSDPANHANWGPSGRDGSGKGTAGGTYAYPGTAGSSDTREDDGTGTMRLVSFTPGGESGDLTAFHMDREGNWSATITIPGPVFSMQFADGSNRSFDCRSLQCGIFSIGAHGKASATNELFTPITFSATAPTPPPPSTTTTKPAAAPTVAGADGGSTTSSTVASTTSTTDDDGAADSGDDDGDDEDASVELTAKDSDGGGVSGVLLAGGGVVVLAMAAGGIVLMRRKPTAPVVEPDTGAT